MVGMNSDESGAASKSPGLLKDIVRWIVPYNLYVALVRAFGRKPVLVEPTYPAELLPNAELRDRHKGERCFIVANGPSALSQDLTRLRGETVFSVSNGYLHRGYEVMRPRYHCVPQLTYGTVTEQDALAWFTEMHAHIGGAELFLSLTEEPLVRTHGLFAGRTIRYLALQESFDQLRERSIPDLCKLVPGVQSVPVMALMIAMYMGFREIFLLGVDHDHFRTGEYRYAFEPKAVKGKDLSVGADGKVITSLYDDFQAMAKLWREYRVLREIAAENGVRIVNASAGGALDEFPRVKLEDVLGP